MELLEKWSFAYPSFAREGLVLPLSQLLRLSQALRNQSLPALWPLVTLQALLSFLPFYMDLLYKELCQCALGQCCTNTRIKCHMGRFPPTFWTDETLLGTVHEDWNQPPPADISHLLFSTRVVYVVVGLIECIELET